MNIFLFLFLLYLSFNQIMYEKKLKDIQDKIDDLEDSVLIDLDFWGDDE